MAVSADDAHCLASVIDAYYKAGGFPGCRGEVNDSVAVVFHTMLCLSRKCSDAFGWVPRPPSVVTVTWLARQIGRAVIERMRSSRESFPCIRAVIWQYGRMLDTASRQDIVMGVRPCA